LSPNNFNIIDANMLFIEKIKISRKSLSFLIICQIFSFLMMNKRKYKKTVEFYPLRPFALIIGKGNKQRIVYFSQKSMYHLKKYLMRRLDEDPVLFVSIRKPHGRLSCRGIEREIRVISDRSEVEKNVHPHIFRHTFATLLLQNGASLVAVQELLGHSDPKTTMTYVSLTNEKKKQSYDQYFVQ